MKINKENKYVLEKLELVHAMYYVLVFIYFSYCLTFSIFN